jgi:hypothetical protein
MCVFNLVIMKLNYIFQLSTILLLLGCSTSESPTIEEDTFWLYTSKIPCDVFDRDRCYSILRQNNLDYDLDKWVLMDVNSELTNFDYEYDNFYQVKVEVPTANSLNPSEYKVVEVLQKIEDFTWLFHLGWKVLVINEKFVPEEKSEDFSIRIDDWKKDIFVEADCNSYSGKLGEVSESNFSLISLDLDEKSTDQNLVCDELGLKDAILSTKKYTLINYDSLILKDANQKVTLILKKIPGPNPYGPKKP